MSNLNKQRRFAKLRDIFKFLDGLTEEEIKELKITEHELKVLRSLPNGNGGFILLKQAGELNSLSRGRISKIENNIYKKIYGGVPSLPEKAPTSLAKLDLSSILTSIGFNKDQVSIIENYICRSYGHTYNIQDFVEDYICDLNDVTNIITESGFKKEDAITMIATKPQLADFSYLEENDKMLTRGIETYHPLELTLPILLALDISHDEIMERIDEVLQIEEPSVFVARDYYFKKEGIYYSLEARKKAFLANYAKFGSLTGVPTANLKRFYETVNDLRDKYEEEGQSSELALLNAVNKAPSPSTKKRPVATKEYIDSFAFTADTVEQEEDKKAKIQEKGPQKVRTDKFYFIGP